MSGRWITNPDGDGITYEAPGGSTAHGDNITLEWPAVVRRESLEALFALAAQVEALTAQLAQAKAARRGATDLFELACERAERAEAKAADLADRLDDAYTMLAVAGTAPEPWLRDTADRLRGVDQ